MLLRISPLIQPHGLMGTVKSKVQSTVQCTVQGTVQCTVQCTVHCSVLFLIQYRYVVRPDTHCACASHPRKFKPLLVFPKSLITSMKLDLHCKKMTSQIGKLANKRVLKSPNIKNKYFDYEIMH